jgi:anti-sigma B factor antagonist
LQIIFDKQFQKQTKQYIMNITITEEGNTITAVFDGRLDTVAAQQIEETITPLLEHADQNIILDCEDMPFISSSGLRIFLKIRKEVAAKGGKMMLRKINPDVLQVFKMTKLDDIFEIIS